MNNSPLIVSDACAERLQKTVTTKELAETLGVDVDTVNNTVNKLGFSEVYRKSTGGRPTKVFTEQQATLIKQEQVNNGNFKVVVKFINEKLGNKPVTLVTSKGIIYLSKKLNTDIDSTVKADC